MSDESLPFVSIVIPVFNEERYLSSCLNSLRTLNYPEHRREILLIDNGSTDQTLDIARGFSEVAIHVKENAKVGAVRNYGVQKAQGSVIVFLDSDCVVSESWLTKGVERLNADPGSVIGGRYLLRDDPSWLEKYWILGSPERSVATALVGGCIFIPKQIFQQVGGFDESLNAGEDNELTERLRKTGFTVKIDLALSVVHLGYPSRLRPFINRQLWHSSDYINGLPASLRDKVFLLTLVFMTGLLGLVSSLMFSFGSSLLIIFSFIIVAGPGVLSAKRIFKSGTRYNRPKDLISIYIIDFLYLIGRSLGVLSGIKNRLSFSSDTKVGRR